VTVVGWLELSTAVRVSQYSQAAREVRVCDGNKASVTWSILELSRIRG
jgi:hypothetical protein